MKPRRPLAERWAERVDKTETCWLWTGNKLPAGYGILGAGGRGGKQMYAHRVSWALVNGPIPDGMFVCHHCDNPPCVNPAHLFLGTVKDNHDDCRRKGRMAPTDQTRHVGADNGRAKLTDDDVREIRLAYASAPRKQRIRRGALTDIANRFGVTTTMVLMIVRGDNWSHVLTT